MRKCVCILLIMTAQTSMKFFNLEDLNKILNKIAQFDKDITVFTADSRISGQIDQFAK
ncbi:hypothetical protein [Bartonella sp. AP58NXGY]|uniref:hypothetical protein n=1 Tax=Bartonella sp. AP58NXGY TaxID=3243498 RepID=UPI0035CEDEFC